MNNKVHGQNSPNDIQKKKNALGQALTQVQNQPTTQIKNTNPPQPSQANGVSQPSVTPQSNSGTNALGVSQVNPNAQPVQTTQNAQNQPTASGNNNHYAALADAVATGSTPANVMVTTSTAAPAVQQNSTPTYLYDSNTDYSKLINSAVAAGNYQQAAIYEQQRNAKIAAEGLNYAQTNYYADYLPGGSKYGATSYVYSYDKNVDYSKLISDAIAAGNFQQAAIYEQQRNAKIAGEGLPYEQTNKYADYLPGGAKYGTVQIAPNDMSPLINQMYEQEAQRLQNGLNQEIQGSVDQLNRALQDAQPTYEAAIANQLLETKQAQDAQALRNQVNGDRGGIGSAQVSSIGNTGAKNREAIAQQQRQLATDTARQIADLRAQGKYQEANLLLQNSQQKLAALYDEQVRMQQQEAAQKNILIDLGSQYLSAGILPSEEMLAAMGIDATTAQSYIDLVKAQQQQKNASASKDGKLVYDDGNDDQPAISSVDDLSDNAKKVYDYIQNNRNIWKSNDPETYGARIVTTVLDSMMQSVPGEKPISLNEGIFLLSELGYNSDAIAQALLDVYDSGYVSEDYVQNAVEFLVNAGIISRDVLEQLENEN